MKRQSANFLRFPYPLALTAALVVTDFYTNGAEPIVIGSFSRNGVMVCSNLQPGSVASVEWAPSVLGPWTNSWAGLGSVAADSNGMIQVSVPMFYRVLGQAVSTPAYLAINELQTAGTGGATDEFVEIYNPNTNAVNMTGWRLVYRSAAGVTETTLFSSNLVVSAQGYLLVTGESYSGSAPSDGPLKSGLAPSGGAVGLRNPGDEVVDSVGWGTAVNALVEGTAAGAPSAGQSLGRIPDGLDSDNNATDFHILSTPTPRAAN